MNIQLYLGFPPSVNKYWVRTRVGMKLTRQAGEYRKQSLLAIHEQIGPSLYIEEPILVTLVMFVPDKRIRDLDNYNKPILDTLVHSGTIIDDSQIDQLFVYRGEFIKGGEIFVRINEAAPHIKRGQLHLV